MRQARWLQTLAAVALMSVAACSSDNGQESDALPEAVASTSEQPTFEPQEVAVKKVDNIKLPERDDGLSVDMEVQHTSYNSQGSGSVVYVLLTNRNAAPFPADALSDPKLEVGGAEVDLLDAGTTRLDRPLGPGASTNLAYAFDTSYNSLYDATFTIGNLEFSGNLNGVSS